MTSRTLTTSPTRDQSRTGPAGVALSVSTLQPAPMGTAQILMAGLFGAGCLLAIIMGAPVL